MFLHPDSYFFIRSCQLLISLEIAQCLFPQPPSSLLDLSQVSPASSLVLIPLHPHGFSTSEPFYTFYRASSVSSWSSPLTALNNLAAPCPTVNQLLQCDSKPSQRPGPACFCRRLFQHLCLSQTPFFPGHWSLWGFWPPTLCCSLAPHLYTLQAHAKCPAGVTSQALLALTKSFRASQQQVFL